MSTITAKTRPNRFRLPLWPSLIAALLVLALLATVALRSSLFQRPDPLQGRQVASVARGPLVDRVVATGAIQPRTTSALAFPTSGGRVERVLVAENDQVTAGQPLILLETRRLAANVAAAEAGVAQAQASLQTLSDGATPAQIAAARAQIDAARGTLLQTEGSVTAADVRAAQARIAEAQALLVRLTAGAKTTDIASADVQLQQAQLQIIQQRDALSAAKSTAELALQQSAQALVQAQSRSAAAQRDWQHVQSTGNDPATDRSLSDVQKAQFYELSVQAQAALRSAQASVDQAQVALDSARQAEVNGIQTAEQQARAAQANSEAVSAGADADAIAAARAQLASAQADLAKLQGQQRTGALQAQQASLANAEAQFAQLTADPKASELAQAQAVVAQAQAQLDLAQTEFDHATLRAPFAGVIGTIVVAPGEIVGQQAPLTLLDISRFVVEVQVDEVGVTQVAVDQSVEIVVDALNQSALQGTVKRITPQSSQQNNVTTYEVLVEIDPAQGGVKPGMTATASIVTAKVDDAITVPAEAVREENGIAVVDVVGSGPDGVRTLIATAVETGLRADGQVEIRSGLNAGQEVALP
ncbi:MAG: efflux RND transporter periplasmic adaptor subunit [Roseiflexaceae bacterium]|nr:efflux RND transporter periplasmic adaptor subunit [Roseiflexaceae bacterium]